MTSTRGRTVFVWPDTHAPFHDEESTAVACAAVKALKPAVLVILGDFFDFWSISRFPKLPGRRADLAHELEGSKPLLKQVDALGVPTVYFLQGNHELRLELFVTNHAHALEGLVPYAKDLIPKRWKYVPYKRSLKLGKMTYSHDFGRHGIQAGRQGLQDLGRNICFGHTHKLDITYVGNHVALNAGWLGDVEQIDYAHIDRARRECQSGFGLVDEDEKGLVWPQAVAIVGGACRVRGQRITA